MPRTSNGEQEFVSDGGAHAPAAEPEPPPPENAVAGRPRAGAGPEVIDARGIASPLPVLRAHRALRAMQPGQELKVITTARETIAEFQALSKYVVGYELLSQEEVGDEIIHVLRKKR